MDNFVQLVLSLSSCEHVHCAVLFVFVLVDVVFYSNWCCIVCIDIGSCNAG